MDEIRPFRTAIADNSRWQNFKPKPDDIYVCTPAKCGTTWTQTIVANLLWPADELPAPVMWLCPWIEAMFNPEKEMLEHLASQQHRRAIKTHSPADCIPWFDDAKYVFVVRDGRDAFMSLVNHMSRMKHMDLLNESAASQGVQKLPEYTGDPHAFFEAWLALEDEFFGMINSYWQRKCQDNVLFVHYNDLKTDLEGEVQRLADFLDIELTREHLARVLERSSFDYMRNHPEMVGDMQMFEGGLKGFIFKGTNGRWKEILTEDELIRYQNAVEQRFSPEIAAWVEGGRRTD